MLPIDLPTAVSYMMVTFFCTSLESNPSLYIERYSNEIGRVPVQLQRPRRY